MKKIFGYISVVSALISMICFFPMVLHFMFVVRDRDLLFNYDKYINKLVVVDSLQYMNMDGSNADRVDGFSKELNNYKTMILFGNIKRDSDYLSKGIEHNGRIKRHIWYRQGNDYAYPVGENVNEYKFPIKNYIYDRLKFPFLWFFSIFLAFYLNKITKIKNNENNENNN